MLTDLLDAAGVTLSEHGFTLDGTFYSIHPYLFDQADPWLTVSLSDTSKITLICWDNFGRRVATPVEFAFVSEEHLVLAVNDVRTLCNGDGKELTGILHRNRDNRIVNRLRAKELLK